MLRDILKVVFILFSFFLFSQNKPILFGQKKIPQSLLINPSTPVNYNYHVGIPVLSHIHANVGSTGFNVYDIFSKDNVDFNQKIKNLINNISSRDFISVNQQTEVLSGGFTLGNTIDKKYYLSFGMYLELDAIFYMPKDLMILATEGNSEIGKRFAINDINFSSEALTVYHIGILKRVNDKISIGARAKIYSSMFNVNSTKNTGYYVTENGVNNIYKHIFDLDFQLNASGIDDSSPLSRVLSDNIGLGLDLGVTNQINERLMVEVSLQDIGFIRHTNGVQNILISGRTEFEGANLLFNEATQGQTAQNYWEDITNKFDNLFKANNTNEKFTTWRPLKLNAALRYSFGRKLNSEDCNCDSENSEFYPNEIGSQLFVINRPRLPQAALSIYYLKNFNKNLTLKTTYTIDSFSYKNVGLGLTTNLGSLNFYIMGDNILEYLDIAKSKSASIQLGFNLVFDKKTQ